mmetsp:Transcript_27946/g.55011  ORF Transcript_27946/g.55011 Transcript_27946/m.55011 type:complete len:236 (+) Transcript_27946:29-736(+)
MTVDRYHNHAQRIAIPLFFCVFGFLHPHLFDSLHGFPKVVSVFLPLGHLIFLGLSFGWFLLVHSIHISCINHFHFESLAFGLEHFLADVLVSLHSLDIELSFATFALHHFDWPGLLCDLKGLPSTHSLFVDVCSSRLIFFVSENAVALGFVWLILAGLACRSSDRLLVSAAAAAAATSTSTATTTTTASNRLLIETTSTSSSSFFSSYSPSAPLSYKLLIEPAAVCCICWVSIFS